MNTKFSFKKTLIVALMLLNAISGVYLARISIYQYEAIASGILGIVVLFLLYRLYLSPKNNKNKPIELLFVFPENIKYFVFGFFWTIVMYWAVRLALDMFLYLLEVITK